MADVFRQDYTPITEEQKAQVLAVKVKAQELHDLISAAVTEGERSDRSRCIAIAKTTLEESVMWAVKGLTIELPQE